MGEVAEAVCVLHVDDDAEFADLAATFLERVDERLTVRTVASAEEGLAVLSDTDVDCVVSDYEMPGRNGVEFLRAVRSDHRDLPFILYTGKGSEEVASEAISAGATDYLQKGSGADQYELLANRITNAVAQYRSERAQQHLVELAEHTDRVLFSFSADWSELLFVSSAYEELWGRSVADLREDPDDFITGVHPDDRDRVREAMERLSGGEALEVEFRVNPDEDYRQWVRVRGEPITDESGTVVRVTGFAADVTEEHRRRERRERQRETLVELATDEAVTAGDFETAVRKITETAAEMLDVARVNVWLTDEDEDALACVDHYDRATGDHSRGRRLAADEHPAYLEALEATQALAADDAREDPRTAELTDSYLDVHDVGALLDGTLRSEGEVIGVVCHEHVGGPREWTDGEIDVASDVADIVHRALQNRARRDQKRELEVKTRAMEAAPIGITISDPTGEDNPLVYANEQFRELTGYAGDEVLGRNCRFLQGENTDPEPVAAMARAIDAAEDVTVELRNYRKDGTEFWNRVTIAPVEDENGELTQFVGFQEDVTERKERQRERERTASELEQKNERLEEFVSIVSHDLRNPLQVAEGRLELAREACDSDHLDDVAGAHERMSALIDDLLALTRHGETVEELERVGLEGVLTPCWQNVDTGDATLETDLDGAVMADRGRLQQVFENLLTNAVEHGGSDVTISVGELEDGFYLEDDGPGIPEGERGEVFAAGFSTSDRGTGFGLAIVEQIVEAHGWHVRATEGSDGGARFEITGVEFVE